MNKMSKIHKKRLLNSAKALRDAAKTSLKKFFTMDAWGHPAGERIDAYFELEDGLVAPRGCETPACVLGHYAARRDLQKCFTLNTAGDIVEGTYIEEILELAMSHFGIDADDAEKLFGVMGCNNAKTPIAAAKYIERFVKQKGAS